MNPHLRQVQRSTPQDSKSGQRKKADEMAAVSVLSIRVLVFLAMLLGCARAESGQGSADMDGSGESNRTTTGAHATTGQTPLATSGDGNGDAGFATELVKEVWFIGLCAGAGSLLLVTVIALIVGNYSHRRKVKRRKAKQEHRRNNNLDNTRRKSVLEQLMGYDPLPNGHVGDLSEADLSMWVASNNQMRLPHVVVDGVTSTPFTSHGVIRSKSQVSMNAKLFVKDWGEDISDAPPTHPSVILNPLYEERLTNGDLVSDDPPPLGRSMQRRPSQLSMTRKALDTVNALNMAEDDGIDWILDAES